MEPFEVVSFALAFLLAFASLGARVSGYLNRPLGFALMTLGGLGMPAIVFWALAAPPSCWVIGLAAMIVLVAIGVFVETRRRERYRYTQRATEKSAGPGDRSGRIEQIRRWDELVANVYRDYQKAERGAKKVEPILYSYLEWRSLQQALSEDAHRELSKVFMAERMGWSRGPFTISPPHPFPEALSIVQREISRLAREWGIERQALTPPAGPPPTKAE